jgi:hypothetical protein
VVLTVIWQGLTWGQSPIQRVHTAEELNGTIHAIWGPLFTIRIIGGGGPTFALVGALLYSGKKGSYSWLLGFLPNFLTFGQYWQPTDKMPWLFGIGGTVILLSYFGILWFWTQTHSVHMGAVKTGKIIQLLGYSVLVVAGLLLCMHFGNPNQLALAELPIPSSHIINISFSLGMLLLFAGNYVVVKGTAKEI